MKKINCSESGMDCTFVARGNTEEEVLNLIADHAANVHGMMSTIDVKNQFRPLIKEE